MGFLDPMGFLPCGSPHEQAPMDANAELLNAHA